LQDSSKNKIGKAEQKCSAFLWLPATFKSIFQTNRMSKFQDTSFKGKKALIRVDFNVPLDEKYNITDDTRIKATVPTIKKVLADGGSVILMSHFGRPKEGPTEKYSLKHLVKHVSELLGTEVQFAADCIGDEAVQKAANLKAGECCYWKIFAFTNRKKKATKSLLKSFPNLVMFTLMMLLELHTVHMLQQPLLLNSSRLKTGCLVW
jgi:hypothetical protein